MNGQSLDGRIIIVNEAQYGGCGDGGGYGGGGGYVGGHERGYSGDDGSISLLKGMSLEVLLWTIRGEKQRETMGLREYIMEAVKKEAIVIKWL
ncbi:hypothetical protein L6452_14231 [Arctium lappa]|uniref:Uncharacterized protein n=1 Tax=Arctium lappa TaxID=4217 RepID=A0ACB9CKA6_ARCLA|nr:hypothetical protein L6452_14231 [Arctium lappa]